MTCANLEDLQGPALARLRQPSRQAGGSCLTFPMVMRLALLEYVEAMHPSHLVSVLPGGVRLVSFT